MNTGYDFEILINVKSDTQIVQKPHSPIFSLY